MNDLKPFKHGEEGTHTCCIQRIETDALCCICESHENCGLTIKAIIGKEKE